jgi:hypothetical protein
VGLDELPRPGVLPRDRDQAAGPKLDELGHPMGGAVEELAITPHDLVKLGQFRPHRQAHHPGIHVQRLHLAGDGHRVLEARDAAQHFGVGHPDLGQDRGEVGRPLAVGVDEDHLKPLLLGQLDGALCRRPPKEIVHVNQGQGLEPLLRGHVDEPFQVDLDGGRMLKMNFRPFPKMEVVEPVPGATIGSLCVSVMFATASVIGPLIGPSTRSTLSCVMSFS